MSTESTTKQYYNAASSIWHVWGLALVFAVASAYGYLSTEDPVLELMTGVILGVLVLYGVTQTSARYRRNRVMD